MGKSLFIALDGIDGCGKGEMVQKLHNYLYSKSKRYMILTTREPTYGKFGKRIRELLKGDDEPKTHAKELVELYTKDRKEHIEKVINPFLAQADGKFPIVICDRYYYSTMAYQGMQGIPAKKILKLSEGIRKPDLALILDVPAKIALERISLAGRAVEKFEKLGFMDGLRKKFLELGKTLREKIEYIDANRKQEDVFADIKKAVDSLL